MKFRNSLIIGIVILLAAQLLFAQDDMKLKDANNKEYMANLSENLINTIDMLSAFKDKMLEMPEETEGINIFNNFLYEMATENSKLVQVLRESDELSAIEREEQIKVLIIAIKSDIDFKEQVVGKELDAKNRALLGQLEAILRDRVKELRKQILKREVVVNQTSEIDMIFLDLHSRNYLYSLMLDFMEPGSKLSAENRDILRQLVVGIQMTMAEQQNQQASQKALYEQQRAKQQQEQLNNN